jgi:hypothetical protein
VTVARETGELLDTTAAFRALLWGATAAVVALAAVAAVLAVRWMLARVVHLSSAIAALDASIGGEERRGAAAGS